ncbi:hypothetical protein [Microvirga makkahensis]|uniref:Uncharacterized protein n=1 Tax=Microvirga makkahensis TaxID=1128670 RepID=A0A7X3MXA1_9HYPH|nr:hypothetical protein [Microvirga makkahensis]MXQ14922.1 hypothetical protein [Microvirga makkahensis]
MANLDFAHRHEVQRIESGKADPALRRQIVAGLTERHYKRRQPYIMLIAELQKHTSSATPYELEMAS